MAVGAHPSQRATVASETLIGVDVGSSRLVTAAAVGAAPRDAVSVDGGPVRDLYAAFQRATHRLHAGELPETTIEEVAADYQPLFAERFRAAADRVLQYARAFDAPVIVLEELGHEPVSLEATQCGRRRCPTWATATMLTTLEERLQRTTIPVRFVDPKRTSLECHRCGEVGDLDRRVLTCTTASCPVGHVDRDRNAALTIAQRGQHRRQPRKRSSAVGSHD